MSLRFLRFLTLVLALLAGAVRAQDMPDLEALPVLSAPGELAAEALPDQGFWLQVAEAGLYTLRLDGPGMLGLTVFATPDGRSDGSDPQERVRAEGSAREAAVMPDLYLLPGRAILVQIAALAPRGVTLHLDQPLGPATQSAPDAPWTPGQPSEILVEPGEGLGLDLTLPEEGRWRIEVLAPPGAALRASLAGMEFGPGGIFPLGPGDPARIELSAAPFPDGTAAPALIRATPLPPDTPKDEREPGDTDLGPLPPEGRRIEGTLLARDDRDSYLLQLDRPGTYDLGIEIPGGTRNDLVLRHEDQTVIAAALAGGHLFRPGLTLRPGQWRIDLSGAQDRPAPYRITLTPSDTGLEGEPDDAPHLARALAEGTAITGTLGPENPGHVTFDVPVAGHLWELRGVQGLSILDLVDGNETALGSWEAVSGALVLRLALPPGRHVARLRGEGAYALRLRDLGPLSKGVEAEPNNTEATAIRLRPGASVTGDFQAPRDVDSYEIVLGAARPLEITAQGPDDGAIVVDILTPEAGTLRAELPAGAPPARLAAMMPAGTTRIEVRARDEGLSGRYALSILPTDRPEPFEPMGTATLPRDGRLTGRIGGFDALDQVFVPLPQGEGTVAIACQGAIRFWEVWTLGDEVRLAREDPGGTVVLPFDPALGGAVMLRLHGEAGDPGGDYACRMVTGVDRAPAAPHLHQDVDAPMPVTGFDTIQGEFTSETDRDEIIATLPEGEMSGLWCDLPQDRLRADDALEGEALTDGTAPFLIGPDPLRIELLPPETGPWPQRWTCAFLPPAAFRTPDQAGPPAAFTGYQDPGADPAARDGIDPETRLALLSGGRPDWLRPSQITEDLALDLDLSLPGGPLRAFSRLGQRAEVTLRARNPGAEPLPLTLDAEVLADGWRLTPARQEITLKPGEATTLSLTLEAPPMQGPAADPQVMLTATAGDRQHRALLPVPLNPDSPEQGPHPFHTAPEALRGGLNPMLSQFGARLMALDDVVIDPDMAERMAFLHDGAALHTAIPDWFRARSATFLLAKPAPIAGLVVHLRTTEPRGTWPARIALDLSPDGETWTRAAEMRLAPSDLPQVLALPAPIEAAFARITVPGCRADPACRDIALSEVGLVAAPAWRLSAPLDLADPALGGHVVFALEQGGTEGSEDPFGGDWNGDLLTPDSPRDLAPARADRGDRVEAVIGFFGGRAGRIAALEWVGLPDEGPRLAGAEVAVSTRGPGGPWEEIGTLPAPGPGSEVARLDLPVPVWARAVRLTFRRDASDARVLPDRIRIWEDPEAPPLLGLWADDRPEAGFETMQAETLAIVTPQGGTEAATAVALLPEREVTSSVQLGRNSDWWRIDVPPGPAQDLTLHLSGDGRPEVTARLIGPEGQPIPLTATEGALTARVDSGQHLVVIEEPPRSVAILWDTSGSVQAFVPGILGAVRLWSQSLQPGRERLQLLPFGQDSLLLPDWAETPEALLPVLAALPRADSSDSEGAMGVAAAALQSVTGQRGIVVVTDGETSQGRTVWGPLLAAMPRVVALSIDAGDARAVTILQDWAGLNGGHFRRVTGTAGLADGLEMAAALFRAPKPYTLSVSLTERREPEGTGTLALRAEATPDAPPSGGIAVVLDASGSMLQRMEDGQRRIAVAHDALSSLVRQTLPPGTPFAFRAFGLQVDACTTELIVPLGPLDPAAAEGAIRAVPAINLARTAIAESLARAAEDLAAATPPRVIVLVTDGEETCGGDVEAEIARLRASGLDLRLTIVGLAIDDAALAETFAGWAEAGGGAYLPAGDGAALAEALARAVAPRVTVERVFLDGRVAAMGTMAAGEERALPAGRYRLRDATGEVMIEIRDGARQEVILQPGLGPGLP